MTEISPTEIVTPPCRLSFPELFEAKQVMGSGEPKFQATLLVPPEVSLDIFTDPMKAAMTKAFGKLIQPKHMPIKKCETKSYAGYEAGWHFIRTASQFQPTVVDEATNPLIDHARIYAGAWCRFYLNVYAYDNKFGQGVGIGLNGVQFIRDGDRLDNRRNAAEVFDPIEVAGGAVAGSGAASVTGSASDMFIGGDADEVTF